MSFKNRLAKELLIFDGAMGTMLFDAGLKTGESPEMWSIEKPDIVQNVHESYLKAGVDIILTNTFGANPLKTGKQYKEICASAIKLAKNACSRVGHGYVAFDIGPCGSLLRPAGDLDFDTAYDSFQQLVLESGGSDLILIETMSDTYELKAAILACKENSDLPIIASFTVDTKGRVLTGADIETVATMVEALGVDAIGLNCGFGAERLHEMLMVLKDVCSLPILIMPNAGMPVVINGKTKYLVTPDEYANTMKKIVEDGACLIGGCCGTSPDHMKKVVEMCKLLPIKKQNIVKKSRVSSYAKTVNFDKSLVIGERINPTGRKLLKEHLRQNDYNYIVSEALLQTEQGADILDINVGLADIDEVSVLVQAIQSIQAVCTTPLQIDTSNYEAMDKALRIYNGRPIINSVNGKSSSMERVFPLAKKYGAMVVALTLDDNGIPEDFDGRLAIVEKILKTAASYGLSKEDLIFDSLAMTVSTNQYNAILAQKLVKYLSEDLHLNTVLGISNISFGLPNRDIINSTFYAQALSNGLKAGIINPGSKRMMDIYFAHEALSGRDDKFLTYLEKYADEAKDITVAEKHMSLSQAIIKGLNEESKNQAKLLLTQVAALSVINDHIMPALDEVGVRFEKGTIYLPQLIASAEAAQIAFELIKNKMKEDGVATRSKGKILLATVKGDIHDIGKNIVKIVLENYGFEIIDLGKDVDPQIIVDTVIKEDIKLVGLSALMTTTVVNMEETIRLIKKQTKALVMVGGAVLTETYAKQINADFYGKDAISSANYANKIFKE